MKAIFRVNSATPFAVSAVRYLCTLYHDSCTRIALAAGLGLLASFAACADSVTTNRYYQASDQAWGGNGYTAALWKLNGEGEPVSPAKGENGCFNEYVAALGWGRWSLVRSLASGNNSFTGDGLTIGDDKDGTFLLRYGGNTLTVDHLTLVRGLITSGVGGETLASSNPIVVRSTTAGPFYFSIGKGRSITIDGPLYSEDDTALVVINRYSLEDMAENDDELRGGTINFNGDNSAYKGKVKVDYRTVYGKGYTGTDSNTNIVLNVNSNNALGGTPAAAMPDALTLSNGGTLAVGYVTSSEAPFAPGGGLRGLTVSNGGRVSSSSALYFAMPVTSSDGSTLLFDCPNQTVTLSAPVGGSVSFDCSKASKVVFATGFEWNSSGTITIGGSTQVEFGAGVPKSLTLKIAANAAVTLSSQIDGAISVDCSAAASLSFANGFEWTSTGTLTLPNGTVVQGPFTWMKSEAGWGGDFTLAEHWSDNADIESGSSKTYLDYGYTARTVNYADNNYEYVFPSAATLVLAGKSSYASLEPKASKITIDHLLMGEYSQFKFSGGGVYSNGDEELYGNVTVASSESAPVKFLSGDGRHDKIFAKISGNGKIIFEHYGSSGKVTLSGDNSGYKGTVEIDADTTVCVAEAKNLGGNPSSRLARGLVLADGSTVEFTAGTLVDQGNRGLYVDGAGTVKNSAEVVWFGPVAFSEGATLMKNGDGQLVFFGDCSAGTVRLGDIGSRVKFKTAYADSVKVESGLPGYRVVIKSEAFEYGANFRVYGLEKIRGLSLFVY